MVGNLQLDMGENGVLIVNDQTQLMSWDGAAEDFFGLSKKHIGISVIEVIPELKAQLLQYQNKKPFEPELTILREGDKSRFILSISAPGNSAESNQTFFVVLRKLSEPSDKVGAASEIDKHYREQMDLSPGAIVIHREGKVVYINPATLELMAAKSAHEVLNRTVIDFVAPAYRETALRRIELLNEGAEQVPVIKEKFIRLDGVEIDVEVMAIPTLFEGKPATKVFFTDITERDELFEQARLQSLALTSVANGIVITDADGVMLWVNPALSKMTGYALEEVVGKTPNIFKSGVQDDAFYENMWQMILSGEVWRGEVVNKRKDGSIYTEEMTLTPLLNDEREVTHFIAIKQDISARSEAIQKLRESEDKLRGFVDHSSDALRLLDEEGVVILWNPANEKINGISSEDALGKKFIDLLRGFESREEIESEFSGGFDKFEALLARFFETGVLAEEIASPEYKVPQPDGSEIHVQASYFTIKTDKGFMIGSVLRDVTEQEMLEKELWESDYRYQTLYNQSNDGVLIMDLDGNIISANDRAKEIYGGDFVGLHPDDIAPEDADTFSFRGPIDRIRAGEHVPVFERQYTKVDGAVGFAEINMNLVHDNAGAPQYLLAVVRDITEKKRIENELRISDERYKSLFDHSSDGVFISDLDVRIMSVNQRGAAITGYEVEELIGMKATDLYFPEDKNDVADKQRKALSGEIIAPYERVFIRKDGTRGVVEVNLSFVYDSEGKPAYSQNFVRDITEKKRIENELEISDLRYKALFERSVNAVLIFDLEARIVAVNQRATDMTGYTVEEMIGMNVHDLASPEERDQSRQKTRLFISGEIIDPYERVLLRKDGTRIVAELNGSVVYDSEGLPRYLQSIMLDVTEKKKIEAELKTSDLRYKALFERSSDGVFIFDMDVRVAAVNQRAADFLGYEIEEMIGMHTHDLVAPEEAERANTKINSVTTGEVIEPYERVFICKDGMRVTGEINATVIYDDEGEPAFLQSIVRDVTEKKNIENELKTSDSRYKALFERSSDAIFIIDRDFRIVTANQRAGDLLGYEVEEMVGMDGHDLSVQEERDQALDKANIAVLGEIIDPYERNLIRKDGTQLVVEINLSVINDAEGDPVFLQSIMRDITHKKELEKQLRFRATHDTLTGLPNRALLYDHLRVQMKQAEDADTLLGVVFIDLDGFKAVNDTFDHARGDMFLVEIANRFKLVLGENDFVSRMGGDEFVFVLAGYAAKDAIQTAVDELLNWIERPYQSIPDSMKISASIGVSVYPGDGDSDEGLIQAADKAMYHIKKHGKNGVGFYGELRD